MKIVNILAAGLLLCIGLSSCEMKDELIGNKNEDTEMGYLDLGVAVNGSVNIITKADDDVTDDGEQSGSSVSAEDFPIIIAGTTEKGNEYTKEFESYKALKEENPVELPVGEYTVKAHSNLKEQKQMSEPFYEGIKEVSITKNQKSKTEVKCTMKNTKIQMVYPESFLTDFARWTITLDDGNKNTLTFTEAEKNPAAVYWMISANVNKLKVNVSATTTEGESITESRELEKPEGGNTAYWTGGDALTITMESYTPDPENPTGVSGIDISVDVTFDETEDTVEVPVIPSVPEGGDTEEPEEPSTNPDEPENPEENLPTLSGKYLEETLTYSKASSTPFPAVEINMNVPAGIKSVWVKVITDNKLFETATAYFGLTTGTDGANLVGNNQLNGMFTLPETGMTTYPFTLGATLAGMLGEFPGNHQFFVKVIDQNDKEASGILKISITE